MSAQRFTPATTQEDVDAIVSAYEQMKNRATKLGSAVAINAQVAKMAQVAMQNLDAALDEGYINQLQYDSYKEVLYGIYEDSSKNLESFLDEVYSSQNSTAQTDAESAPQANAEENIVIDNPELSEYKNKTARRCKIKMLRRNRSLLLWSFRMEGNMCKLIGR